MLGYSRQHGRAIRFVILIFASTADRRFIDIIADFGMIDDWLDAPSRHSCNELCILRRFWPQLRDGHDQPAQAEQQAAIQNTKEDIGGPGHQLAPLPVHGARGVKSSSIYKFNGQILFHQPRECPPTCARARLN
jgi:hypothetical protein